MSGALIEPRSRCLVQRSQPRSQSQRIKFPEADSGSSQEVGLQRTRGQKEFDVGGHSLGVVLGKLARGRIAEVYGIQPLVLNFEGDDWNPNRS